MKILMTRVFGKSKLEKENQGIQPACIVLIVTIAGVIIVRFIVGELKPKQVRHTYLQSSL
jgi:hypothetical protein